MTFAHRLYADFGELFEFDATVTGVEKTPEGTYELVLDQTAFFPGGGGQERDMFLHRGNHITVIQV